ncbi:MAG: NADH-ubiquinone oxidoreductase-F iron-sulfur binding region domain-containing protein [Pseudomonadota bacterium]
MSAEATNCIEKPQSQDMTGISGNQPRITVCGVGNSASTCGGDAIYKGLIAESKRLNIPVVVEPAKCGCSGKCNNGTYISLPHLGLFYHKVKEAHIPIILKETIGNKKILFPILYVNPLQSIREDLIWDKTSSCIMTMDPSVCMVEIAEYLIKFHANESCGKCVPCRLGIQRLIELISGVANGKAPDNAVVQMETMIQLTDQAAYCDFAGKVSKIIMAIVSNFKEEFEKHIKEKRCQFGVCSF